MSGVGFYVALSTKLKDGERNEFFDILRRWLKLSGWTMAVMGTLIAIRILLVMVGFMTR